MLKLQKEKNFKKYIYDKKNATFYDLCLVKLIHLTPIAYFLYQIGNKL